MKISASSRIHFILEGPCVAGKHLVLHLYVVFMDVASFLWYKRKGEPEMQKLHRVGNEWRMRGFIGQK